MVQRGHQDPRAWVSLARAVLAARMDIFPVVPPPTPHQQHVEILCVTQVMQSIILGRPLRWDEAIGPSGTEPATSRARQPAGQSTAEIILQVV